MHRKGFKTWMLAGVAIAGMSFAVWSGSLIYGSVYDSGRLFRRDHPRRAAQAALEVKRECTEAELACVDQSTFDVTYRYQCRDGVTGLITVDYHLIGHAAFGWPQMTPMDVTRCSE